MSITNQVISNFPSIANYDANANILGLTIQSTINSVTSNVGGLIVGNLTNPSQSIGIGMGNINVGNTMSVGGNTTIAGNITASNSFTISQNANIAGNVVIGNSSAPANNSLTIYSTANAANTSTTGAVVITSNIANPLVSTSIGNGSISTGGNLNVFGNRIVVTPGATSTANNTPGITNGTLFYGGSNTTVAPTIQLNGANSTWSGLQILSTASERWFIGRDPSTNTGNFVIRSNASVNNMTVMPGNGQLVVNTSNTSVFLNSPTGNIAYQSGGGFHNFNGVTLGTRPVIIYNGRYSSTYTINSGTLYYPPALETYSSCTPAQFGLTQTGTTSVWTNNSGGQIWVLVSASIAFGGNSSGIRRVIIYRNPNSTDTGEIVGQTQMTPSGNQTVQLTASALVPLNNGDSIGVGVIQTSGSTLVVPGVLRNPTCISLVRM